MKALVRGVGESIFERKNETKTVAEAVLEFLLRSLFSFLLSSFCTRVEGSSEMKHVNGIGYTEKVRRRNANAPRSEERNSCRVINLSKDLLCNLFMHLCSFVFHSISYEREKSL